MNVIGWFVVIVVVGLGIGAMSPLWVAILAVALIGLMWKTDRGRKA